MLQNQIRKSYNFLNDDVIDIKKYFIHFYFAFIHQMYKKIKIIMRIKIQLFLCQIKKDFNFNILKRISGVAKIC